MLANFAPSVAIVLQYEGGATVTNDKDDSGGLTKYGITQTTYEMEYPGRSVRNATQDEAEHIYKKRYWDAVCGDVLPIGLDFAVFQAAVHMGVPAAIMMLQKVLGIEEDGIPGAQTVSTARKFGPMKVMEFLNEALDKYDRIIEKFPVNAKFKRGWRIRALNTACDVGKMLGAIA